MVMSNQIVMKNAVKNILDTTEIGNISNRQNMKNY